MPPNTAPKLPVFGKEITQGYLIKSGRVFDDGRESWVDIRIKGKTIVEIAPNLPPNGDKVVDASGLLVTPGLIDLHVHVFSGMGLWAIDPSDAGLRTGVTAMLDTGTAGAMTYPAFHRFVISQAREEVYALINISMVGCLATDANAPHMSDMTDERAVYAPAVVDIIRRYPDRAIGTKVRLTAGIAANKEHVERAGLQGAISAARQTGTFCMIHHANSLIQTPEVLAAMAPGDVYTHLYHPWHTGPFRNINTDTPALQDHTRRARDRGILFDVGHGGGAFAWQTAVPMTQNENFWPDTISSDLHSYNIAGPVFDLPTTMTKLLHLGMPLAKVIQATTQTPAQAMRLSDRLGRIQVGRQADLTLLALEPGNWPLYDVLGEVQYAKERLAPKWVVKSGELLSCK
jgi:dihydroorotase